VASSQNIPQPKSKLLIQIELWKKYMRGITKEFKKIHFYYYWMGLCPLACSQYNG